MLILLATIASLQQQPSGSPTGTSGIAAVTVEPAEVALQVGDTVRLKASARDSAGRALQDITIRWFQSGGHFEGKVDSTGLVTGGSTGTPTPSALVSRETRGAPAARLSPVTGLPQPAAKPALGPQGSP